MDRTPIVDTHQHFWDLAAHSYPWLSDDLPRLHRYGDTRAIRRTYLPDDYRRDVAGYAVVKTVHVEANIDPVSAVAETRWLRTIRATSGWPSVIVSQASLDRDDAEAVLAAHAAFPEVRGIRHIPRAAPSPDSIELGAPGSLGDPKWRRGYRLLERFGFTFDLQVPFWHLSEGADLARDIPGVRIILNSTGHPIDRSAEGLALWRQGMRALAAEPNVVAVKIAGLGTGAKQWPFEANRDIVRFVIDTFGIDRCLFGSNFPPDSLAATFGAIVDALGRIIADRPNADRAKLFHDNAVRVYRID